jgi:hypothetical protein
MIIIDQGGSRVEQRHTCHLPPPNFALLVTLDFASPLLKRAEDPDNSRRQGLYVPRLEKIL